MADRTTLRLERILDAPIETVWAWLTESDKRERWFAAGPADLRVGGDLTLVFDHDALSDTPVPYPPKYAKFKGHRAIQAITECEPPHVFAFTFERGVARFELSSAGKQTKLVLTHDVAPEDRVSTGGGWDSHLDVLQARLAGRSVPDFWALHFAARERVGAGST